MPFNGSGTFTRLYNWVTDRNNAIKIRADRMDAEIDGIATGLSNTITRDGQTVILQNIPFNDKKITGLGAATLGTDAVNRDTADARYPQLAANNSLSGVNTFTQPLVLPAGTAAAPSLAPTGDSNTGVYHPAADTWAVTTGGTERLRATTTETTFATPIVHPAGTAGAPAIYPTGDSNTGIWSPAADTLAVSTGGTERLRITSAGNATFASPLILPAGTAAAPAMAPTGDSNTGTYYPAADTIAFTTGGSERLRIDSSGNVGIGTSSPSATLDVNGSIVTNASLTFNRTTANSQTLNFNNSDGNDFYIDAFGGRLRFHEASPSNVERMTILAGGNVGIGTSSPSSALHVAGGSGSTIRNVASAGSSWFVGANVESYILHNESNTSMLFTTNGTERMRIDASGNVGIGTSSPSSFGKFAVTGSAGTVFVGSSGQNIVFTNGGTNFITTSTAGGQLQFQTGASSNSMIINSSGNVGIGTTNPATFLLQVAGNCGPNADNVSNLGSAGLRWKELFAGTGTINTSDAREKTPVRAFTDAERAAAREIVGSLGVFQWLASVEEKGKDKARLHIGTTVQSVIEIMERHKLNPWRYAFICRDKITKWSKRKVKRLKAKTETKTITEDVVEVINGKPTLVTKTREIKEPVVEMLPVLDADGKPIVDVREEAGEPDKDGNPTTTTIEAPRLHPVPVMVEVEVEEDYEEPAGDRLGLRTDQMVMFVIAALADADAQK